MTSLVVMTVGRSDVQWLGHVGEQLVRLPLHGREVQQALLSAGAGVHWCHDPAVRAWPELSRQHGAAAVAAHLAAGRDLVLFAPKLAPCLPALSAKGSASAARVGECLILHTERALGTPFAAEEPVAAAPLIARCLAGAPWHWPVKLVHGLRGQEDAANPEDQRRVAGRLLVELVNARQRGCDRVLLLDAGGLPALKEVASLLCQSVFGPAYVERLGPGHSQPVDVERAMGEPGAVVPLRPDDLPRALASIPGTPYMPAWPACHSAASSLESELRTRLAVTNLIQRCHLGSLPALLPEWQEPGALPWAAQVAAAVAWHTQAGYVGPLTSWPGGPAPGTAGQPGLSSGPPATWVQAFRIECALATGANLEALMLTVEWFETLLVKAILVELQNWFQVEHLSLAEDGTVAGLEEVDAEWIAARLASTLPTLEPAGVWGVTKPNGAPVVMLALLPPTRRQAAPALVLRRLHRDAVQAWCGVIQGPWGPVLTAFHVALRREVGQAVAGGGPAECAYHLRNLKAHQGASALGPDAAHRVRQAMTATGLWHAASGGLLPGQHFLGRPLPAAVLALLGLPGAGEQFRDWLGGLERLVCEAPLERATEKPLQEV